MGGYRKFGTPFGTPFGDSFGLLNSSGAPLIPDLIYDEFPTAGTAPLTSPNVSDPGPGSLTIIDSAGTKASKSGGRLRFATPTTTANADPRAEDPVTRHRMPGRMLSALVNQNGQVSFGFGLSTSTFADKNAIAVTGANVFILDKNLVITLLFAVVNGQDATYYVMQRLNGGMIWVQLAGQTSPKLVWVGSSDNLHSDNLVARVGSYAGSGATSVDNFRLADYGGEYSKAFPLAFFSNWFPANNDTGTMPADACIEVKYHVATGETFDFSFRRTDDDNRYIARITVATNTLSIVERAAGVETVKATNTFASGTIANLQWCSLYIRCEGVNITICANIYGGNANRILSYNSATFNQTATGWKVSGAGLSEPLYALGIYALDLPPPSVKTTRPYKIIAFGDSRTASNLYPEPSTGYPFYVCQSIEAQRGTGAHQIVRLGHPGFTVAQLQAVVDSDITAAGTKLADVDAVLINMSINDMDSLPVQATWQTNYGYILDAFHVACPNAVILISKVFGTTSPSICDTMDDTWLPNVLATRSWVTVVADERIIIKDGDNGAALLLDSRHWNTAGHQVMAAAYLASIPGH